jgi:hypothetical protein
MILTQCAVCATDLGLTLGKKCGRCSTRYCGADCQKQHWEGGHDKLCKKIKKAGGAEQFNANEKYTEAIAVAAKACAEDTKGQTCYICTEAVHRHTGEGLVRGCACHTTEGFVHVSCLAEQAKILVAEAEENNLDLKVKQLRWNRWNKCSLCEQQYHGVVYCALGWACWKTYLGRPEADEARGMAMSRLGVGLSSAERHADALTVREAEMSMLLRVGAPTFNILAVQANLATTYSALGRTDQSQRLKREVYYGYKELLGEEHEHTILVAENYAWSLIDLRRFEEAKTLLQKMVLVAQRVHGETDIRTIKMQVSHASALCMDPCATLDDLQVAVTSLEERERIARRVLGGTHPLVLDIERKLQNAREFRALGPCP